MTMRIDPDTCRDPELLVAEVRRLQAILAERADLTDQNVAPAAPFCWAVVSDGELYGSYDTQAEAKDRWGALLEVAPEREFNVIPLFTESGCHVSAQKNLTLTDAQTRTAVATDNPPEAAESVGDPVSVAGKSVETANIPPAWLSRPYWVDPPSGWRYGFPRLYDPQADGSMREWMIRHGYPERLARLGLTCTFTECAETGEK